MNINKEEKTTADLCRKCIRYAKRVDTEVYREAERDFIAKYSHITYWLSNNQHIKIDYLPVDKAREFLDLIEEYSHD